MIKRYFRWYLRNRALAAPLILAFLGVAGYFAYQVKNYFDVHQIFPASGKHRQEYERLRSLFDHEERPIFAVQGDKIFTPPGLKMLGELEAELRKLPEVIDVKGPMSADRVVAQEDWVQLEKLFPSADLPQEDIDRRVKEASEDPVFRYAIVRPDGGGANIVVTVTKDGWHTPEGRKRFTEAADRMIASFEASHPGIRVWPNGYPVAHHRFTDYLEKDSVTFVPIALTVVMILLFLVFRSWSAVAVALTAIGASLVLSRAAIHVLGYTNSFVMTMMPIYVLVITVADAVHIINDYLAERRAGVEVQEAIANAMASTTIPCLLTEVVISVGFLSLLAFDVIIVREFAIVTSVGILLIWVQNVTVLPLVLSFLSTVRKQEVAMPPKLVEVGQRVVGWMIKQSTVHHWRTTAIALGITAVATWATFRVDRTMFVWDEMKVGSKAWNEIRAVEKNMGGVLPVSIFAEVDRATVTENPALEPELIRVMDRAAKLIRSLPRVGQASSLGDPLRMVHRSLASDPGPDQLPDTRSLAVQEVALIDDGNLINSFVTFDRYALSAFGYMDDAGTPTMFANQERLQAFVAEEQARLDARKDLPKVHLSASDTLRMVSDSYRSLAGGVLGSLGTAVLITFLVFTIVLRSWRLGIIGLVPNVMPVFLLTAAMVVFDIRLRIGTGLLFAMVIVMADEDTIQFLSRFRGHFRVALAKKVKEPTLDVYREAIRTCLGEVGVPMLVTSTAVSLGFLTLLGSRFMVLVHTGILLGVTLFSAMFADLFFTPVLILAFKPRMIPKAEEEAILKGELQVQQIHGKVA